MASVKSSNEEKPIPWVKALGHIWDIENHLEELYTIKKKLREKDIENEEADMSGTALIVKFHEKLTMFLKSLNIRTLT